MYIIGFSVMKKNKMTSSKLIGREEEQHVLQKALALGLKPIVVVNKVDKPNCRPEEVQEAVFELELPGRCGCAINQKST